MASGVHWNATFKEVESRFRKLENAKLVPGSWRFGNSGPFWFLGLFCSETNALKIPIRFADRAGAGGITLNIRSF